MVLAILCVSKRYPRSLPTATVATGNHSRHSHRHHVRAFSDGNKKRNRGRNNDNDSKNIGKDPKHKDAGGNSNSSDARTEKYQKNTMAPREAAWLERQQEQQKQYQQEQYFQRFSSPSRFGPKSQKYFELASPKQRYGIRNLNLEMVKDSAQVPILIPGKTINDEITTGRNAIIANSTSDEETKGDNKHPSNPNNVKQRQRRRRRTLPTVNAAALLDAQAYCKRSAFTTGKVTKSGTEAAKRLLRGKKDLVDMLRGNIVLQQSSRPFCLAGHGVPKQLLQDHLNLADLMLREFNEPAELSFAQQDDGSSCIVPPALIKVREHDGQARVCPWPQESASDTTPELCLPQGEEEAEKTARAIYDSIVSQQESWSDRIALYLAVMNRFASKLGFVGSYLDKGSKKNMSVKMYRGMAYPVEVISRLDGDGDHGGPVPILQLSSVNRISDRHPHVSIRLQGTPDILPGNDRDGSSPPNPVTLVYGACFEEDPRLEPIQA